MGKRSIQDIKQLVSAQAMSFCKCHSLKKRVKTLKVNKRSYVFKRFKLNPNCTQV